MSFSPEQKETIVTQRKETIDTMRKAAQKELAVINRIFNTTRAEIMRMTAGEQETHANLYRIGRQRREDLSTIIDAPYFFRTTMNFDADQPTDSPEVIHIGKFSLPDQKVYSWVAPVAQLRFSDLGNTQYPRPRGINRHVFLHDQETLMATNGEISYLSRTDESGKNLIYQKHFSEKLSQFELGDIVAQMERAQDTIIRAPHKGSFLISGPAGSGKTTVALHRLGFLAQAPETADIFPGESCIVFVQDSGTQDYFTHLLPSLGINNVTITTFIKWARNLLDLDNSFTIVQSFGESFVKRHSYSYTKSRIVDSIGPISHRKSPFAQLSSLYKNTSTEFKTIFAAQEKSKTLDVHDLTALLFLYKEKNEQLERMETYHAPVRGSKHSVTKKRRRATFSYQAILVDEFQNYTPTQLQLIHSTLSSETQTMTYIGDLAQQTHMGSIASWDDIGEDLPDDRIVKLQSVYRNAPAILEFLKQQGYQTPEIMQEGFGDKGRVVRARDKSVEQVVADIRAHAKQNAAQHIGVIAFEKIDLEEYENEFENDEQIHLLEIEAAQGLEFDAVWVLERPEIFSAPAGSTEHFAKAYEALIRDYRYVAYTRAKIHLEVIEIY